MKINHKDSYFDFGNQFKVDHKIDGYHGSKEMLEDIVYPFKLNKIKNKLIMEVGCGSGRILKNLVKYNPKKFLELSLQKPLKLQEKIMLKMQVK